MRTYKNNPKQQKQLQKTIKSSQLSRSKNNRVKQSDLSVRKISNCKRTQQSFSKTLKLKQQKQETKCNNTRTSCKSPLSAKQNIKTSKMQNKKIIKQTMNGTTEKQYIQAVKKVFNILDIFSRGVISQANINRWIPQAALYFLGTVFQKIRTERVSLNQNQFTKQSMRIFTKSMPQDIQYFIQSIKKHQNSNEQKISLQGSAKQTIQSLVQDRYTFKLEGGNTSFRKNRIQMEQKTLPLQAMKYKDLRQDQPNNSENKNLRQFKMDKIRNHISPLQDLNNFQNVMVTSGLKQNKIRLPKNENLPLQFNKQQMKQKLNIKTQQFHEGGTQSPFFRQSISNVISRTVANKRRQNLQSDRIDKLSMKLEDHIKQNAARIQKSKNCRIQL